MDHYFMHSPCPEQISLQMPQMVKQAEYLMRHALRAAHAGQGINPGEFLSGMLLMGGTGTPERVVLRSGIILDAAEDPYDNLDLQTCLRYLCCGGLRILSKEGDNWEYASDQDAFFRFFNIRFDYECVPQRPCKRRLRAGDFGRSMLRLYRILTADSSEACSPANRDALPLQIKALIGVIRPLCSTRWEYQDACNRLMVTLQAALSTVDPSDETQRQQADALFAEGCRLQRGDGVPRDPEAAVRRYREAAAAGHLGAHLALARCQQLEDGMPWNIPVAVQTYQALADNGYGPAMRALGDCYRRGIGVEADPLRTLTLYAQAARAGDPFALEALRELLSDDALLAAFHQRVKASDDAH